MQQNLRMRRSAENRNIPVLEWSDAAKCFEKLHASVNRFVMVRCLAETGGRNLRTRPAIAAKTTCVREGKSL
jgi:hypothetical protein